MRRWLKSNKLGKLTDEDGFTLDELIAVVVITSILFAIAVTIYSDVSRKPANEAHKANQRTLISAVHMAFTKYSNDCFTINVETKTLVWGKINKFSAATQTDEPGWDGFLSEWPEVPSGAEDYSAGVEYKVYLEMPGPKIIGLIE